jgi:Mg2+ and Co2+ transporter CorA
MPPQSARPDYSFAVFPAPNVARAIPSDHHPRFEQSAQSPPLSRVEELFAEIKRQYDILAPKNAILSDSYRQLHGQREEALQMSQRKDQYLQAAQRRIQELEEMVNHSKDIVAQM